jgi:hypothetical protein
MSTANTRSEGLHLVVFDTEEVLRVLPFPAAGVVTIGRGGGNTVKVTDGAVSRRHVKIAISSERAEPRLTVEDLGSTNGTRVNDAAIQPASPTTFSLGEMVIVGSTVMVVVRCDSPPAPGLLEDLREAFDRRQEEVRIDLMACEAALRAREAVLNAKRMARRGAQPPLTLVVPPKGKPPAPSSSGAPLALPGPGYLFDDLIRGRGGRR